MVSPRKVVVRLTDDERRALTRLIRTGTHPAAMLRRAQVLLKADADGPDAWSDLKIGKTLGCSFMTVRRVRLQFAAGGLDATLHRRRPTGRQYRKLDGKQEAQLIAAACSPAPAGRARWTMKLLAERLVELEVVGSIDPATVCRTLQKTRSNRGLNNSGSSHPGTARRSSPVPELAALLDVYARPHDPSRPVVCVDEAGKQLIGDVREPLPVRPGTPARQDSEYVRGGMTNLFIAFEPLAGTRHVEVTERKTSVDFAHFLRAVSDEHYAAADAVVLVCDNLSTHTPAALYEAFEPAEARRLAKRFEWHYTPKHGSWLNVAEMELSVLARQCLDRRIPDMPTLSREVAAWQTSRNAAVVKVDWQFTTNDARVKLKRLYPAIQLQ